MNPPFRPYLSAALMFALAGGGLAAARPAWFPFAERSGAFIGIDGGVAQLHVEDPGSNADADQTQVALGVNGGYRFDLPYGFFATPWLGISYTLESEDLRVGDRTFDNMPITFFPAVHLGYRFD